MLAELASRGYPAMALDLRGHGESPFGPPDDFGAETLARDVWDAVAAHGVRPRPSPSRSPHARPRPHPRSNPNPIPNQVRGPVVLVGHSMGGRVT